MPPQDSAAPPPPGLPGQPISPGAQLVPTPTPEPQPMQQPLPQPPVPPGPVQQPQIAPAQPMQLNPAYSHDKLAVASLVLGIVSLPASILNILTLPIPVIGIVLGFISLKRNKGFALAGIILSFIGVILSVIIFAVGSHILHNRASLVGSGGANGGKLSSACYEFSLPEPFKSGDVNKNTDCTTLVINASSTEDMGVQSAPLPASVSDANVDSYLKSLSQETENYVGGKGLITSRHFTTLDGVHAYEATGTENYGSYKYLGFLVAVAPREYTSATGTKLRTFIIEFDSATSPNQFDNIVKSWHWQ